MAKGFLGAAALAGTMFSFCGGAYAEETTSKPPPEAAKKLILEISGKTSFNAIMGHQSQKGQYQYVAGDLIGVPTYMSSQDQSGMFTVDGSKLAFNISGKTDSEIEYGFYISFSGDKSETNSVIENYLTLRGDPGTLLLGNTKGVDDKMSFGGADTQVGTGGIDGNFTRFINPTYGVPMYVYLGYYSDTSYGTKISYMTPRWEGFMLGVSFTPDGKHGGEAALNTASNPNGSTPPPYHRDALGVGLNYIQEFHDKFKVSISLTSLSSQMRPERSEVVANQSLARSKSCSWAIGGLVEYDKFLEVGAEYIDNRKSAQFTANRPAVNPGVSGLPPIDYVASNATAGSVWNVGLGYTFGPTMATKASIGYLSGQRKTGFSNYKATSNIVTAGIEQKLGEGFVVYGEYANYNLKNLGAPYEARLRAQSLDGANVRAVVKNQTANAVIIGTKIQF